MLRFGGEGILISKFKFITNFILDIILKSNPTMPDKNYSKNWETQQDLMLT